MTPLGIALESKTPFVREVVPRILPILIIHAQNSRTLTYKDLALQIDEYRRLRHLDKPLDSIGTFVRSIKINGRFAPPLESIVVKHGTSLPGRGSDYLLVDFLKRQRVIKSKREFAADRKRYVRIVHDEVFSFPWHRCFGQPDLNNSRPVIGHGPATSRSAIDPGAAGTHFRSGGAFEGRHNPVVLALSNNLPEGWKLVRGVKSKCDLAVEKPNASKQIFEVKCGISNQDMYAALGELIFHTEVNKPAQGVAVVPGNLILSKQWTDIFRKHRFPIVEYFSKAGGFEFKNLTAILAAR